MTDSGPAKHHPFKTYFFDNTKPVCLMANYDTNSPLTVSAYVKPRVSSLSIHRGSLWMIVRRRI